MSRHPVIVRPYYEEEKISLYLGDCGELLPLLPKADLLITDPPYGIQFRSNYRKKRHQKIVNDDKFPIELVNLAIEKATAAAYIFCRWETISSMEKPNSVLAWVKNNWSMGDLKHEHGRQWEACCFYAKENHAFIKRIPDVIYASRTNNDLHPTQKPISLLGQLILANVGDVVLDPFAGSGSTLIAARQCNRRAIGIEIDEQYCEVIANRLRQTEMHL